MTEATVLPCSFDQKFAQPQKGKIDGVFTESGKFRKVRVLGRGAFGKAYLVETVQPCSGLQKEAAPLQKVLKKVSLTGITQEKQEAAWREAIHLRKISRGCVFIAQFGEVFLAKKGTQLCIVMEYCAGGDLRTALRDRGDNKLEEAQLLAWVAQVALALRHCHSHRVLHRDVKPENCLFRTQGGDLLLADFGISCETDTRSLAKTCLGSPHYLSPEIVNQEPYSYASDVWSFGVMFYEMAALEAPFKGSNICQLAFRIVSATPASLQGAGYSAPVSTLVECLMEKDATKRTTLDGALMTSPLCEAASAVCLIHGMDWPPRAATISEGRRPWAQRLRSDVNAVTAGGYPSPVNDTNTGECQEYLEDFEPEDGDIEECEYPDDFETGSEGSYEADFEAASDNEDDELAIHGHDMEDIKDATADQRVKLVSLMETLSSAMPTKSR